jgi:uncharacterized protein involved in response to NO
VDRFITRPFIWLSLGIGLGAGFGIGTGALLAVALGLPVGAWWAAMAQAHGHAQVFGFAGLMVFGVGFLFLPRLRGAPLWGAQYVPWVLRLYAGGVLLRVAAQMLAPFLAVTRTGPLVVAASFGIALSGLLTLAGGALAVVLLVQTARHGPPVEQRIGLMHVLPLLAAAWLGLLASLVVNAWGTLSVLDSWRAVPGGVTGVRLAPWLVPPIWDALTVRLALLGWLVPLAIAFAARNFPLFLWTQLAPAAHLRWGMALFSVGLGLELVGGIGAFGRAAGSIGLIEVGRAFAALGLLWLTGVVGALGPKSEPPGGRSNPEETALAEIASGPLVDAFVWLAIAGGLMLLQSALPAAGLPPPPEDAVRHALGAGFVLLLIVGMALRLIPGLSGGKRRVDLRAARVAALAAQIAALLRVAPLLAVWLLSSFGIAGEYGRVATILLAAAGLAGAVSIAALWQALRESLAFPTRSATAESSER